MFPPELVAPVASATDNPRSDDPQDARRRARAARSSAETCSEKSTWQHVAAELDKAVAGADTADVSVALKLVLSL